MPKKWENDAFMSELCRDIHAGNIKAGWWDKPRNRAELLMLTVSELSEASEGFERDLADDKLPQYPMLNVELADTAIRLCDQIGALGEDEFGGYIAGCYIRGKTEAFGMRKVTMDSALMHVINILSRAMEHDRKGRERDYRMALWDALMTVIRFADRLGIDILEVIEAKREFNRHREDHKIEVRRAAGGKAY